MVPHVLMVPLPETGHINPLMHLAKYLASRGCVITFVNTHYNHMRILQSNRTQLLREQGLDIRLVGIPDGLSEQDNRDNDVAMLFKITDNIGPPLENLMKQLNQEGPVVTCIISDVTVPKTVAVANKFGISRVAFWPTNIAIHALICHAVAAISEGKLPPSGVPDESIETICFPGLPPIRATQLPWMVGNKEVNEFLFQFTKRNLEALRGCEWVLCNSFHDLESKTIDLLPRDFPMCPVGPILTVDVLTRNCPRDKSINVSTGLWTEEYECLEWLDTQAPSSVLYVSLGSIAVLKKDQLFELALGLEATQRPFLWVVRSDLTGETGVAHPEGFLERTKERSRIVSWAPQLLVLSHSSVGGFLTHCGWNSTIESIAMGVPMLAWPQLADQFVNSQLVVGEWKVGLAMDREERGMVGRVEIERQVGCLMQGVEGEEARERVGKLREAILVAVRDGGSSYKILERFVEWLREQTPDHTI